MNTRHARYAASRSTVALPRPLLAWWYGLPTELRSTKWPATLAFLTILALLMGFHAVVQSAVKQGELLRMSVATRTQAEWRCHALQGDRQRAHCLRQLDAAPGSDAVAAAADVPPPNTAALQVAQR
jgi:hypothetical protein